MERFDLVGKDGVECARLAPRGQVTNLPHMYSQKFVRYEGVA